MKWLTRWTRMIRVRVRRTASMRVRVRMVPHSVRKVGRMSHQMRRMSTWMTWRWMSRVSVGREGERVR